MEPIPFLNLSFQHEQVRDQVKNAFLRVYDRNWFVLGREVEGFEKEYAEFSGTPFCVGVANGLDGLTLALQSEGIRPGDEVIVPAHTYLATWLAVTRAGGVPVPVDADPVTYNIDVTRIEERITPRTKVILPVHLYGQACNMTVIDELSRQHKLTIVEDNAQSHGAMWRQKRTGSFGLTNATSFYPTKNLGALGDGGAITTFDEKTAVYLRTKRNYGFEVKNHSSEKGVNSRLDEIQAAILRIKLLYLEEWNDWRRKVAAQYLESLNGVGDLQLPLSDKEAVHVYHLFVVQTARRNDLREHLAAAGIETMIHYPIPPHLQKAYHEMKFRKGDFLVTEKIADSCLSLPLWPGMEERQLNFVTEKIKKFFDR